MKIYYLGGQNFDALIHMDAYRLKGAHHLKVLGWDELIQNPKNLICIEWPEKIEGGVPEDAIPLMFRYSEDEGRILDYGTNNQ